MGLIDYLKREANEVNTKTWGVLAVVVLMFLVFVWPGVTTYAVLTAANGQALLQVNRLTGKATMIANTFPPPPPAAPQAPPAMPAPPGMPVAPPAN